MSVNRMILIRAAHNSCQHNAKFQHNAKCYTNNISVSQRMFMLLFGIVLSLHPFSILCSDFDSFSNRSPFFFPFDIQPILMRIEVNFRSCSLSEFFHQFNVHCATFSIFFKLNFGDFGFSLVFTSPNCYLAGSLRQFETV